MKLAENLMLGCEDPKPSKTDQLVVPVWLGRPVYICVPRTKPQKDVIGMEATVLEIRVWK